VNFEVVLIASSAFVLFVFKNWIRFITGDRRVERLIQVSICPIKDIGMCVGRREQFLWAIKLIQADVIE
jgi:hypothetical protein